MSDELLSYLARHPQAADSLDGILQWWRPRQRYETERGRIEEALEKLVQGNRIVKHRLIDGTTVYALRRPEAGDDEAP